MIFLAGGVCSLFLRPGGLFAQEAPEVKSRDPFVSLLDQEKQNAQKRVSRHKDLSQFALKGIIWNKNLSVAIINDELFVPGDPCNGLKIEEIASEAVTLTDGTDSFEISLADGEAVSSDKTVTSAEAAKGPIETGMQQPQMQERPRSFLGGGPRQPSAPGRNVPYTY